jgi:hypothetical protein
MARGLLAGPPCWLTVPCVWLATVAVLCERLWQEAKKNWQGTPCIYEHNADCVSVLHVQGAGVRRQRGPCFTYTGAANVAAAAGGIAQQRAPAHGEQCLSPNELCVQ